MGSSRSSEEADPQARRALALNNLRVRSVQTLGTLAFLLSRAHSKSDRVAGV